MKQYEALFESIIIRNTRSRGTDTDFANIAVSVNGEAKLSPTVSLGNLNNGIHGVGAKVQFDLPDTATEVGVAISVVNAGHASQSSLDSAMQAVGTQVASSVTSDQAKQQLITAILNFFGGYLNPNCDGPVVTAIGPVDPVRLRDMQVGTKIYALAGDDYGHESAHGCGSNSNYGYSAVIYRRS